MDTHRGGERVGERKTDMEGRREKYREEKIQMHIDTYTHMQRRHRYNTGR